MQTYTNIFFIGWACSHRHVCQ